MMLIHDYKRDFAVKIPNMWVCSYKPKEKPTEKRLIDNYDKTCHILDLNYNKDVDGFVGKCSLCGAKNFLKNRRCIFCRAKIEEDSRIE